MMFGSVPSKTLAVPTLFLRNRLFWSAAAGGPDLGVGTEGVDVCLGVGVAGAHERAKGVLEVLHLVAVAVPVDGEHRVEIAVAIRRRDVRRHQIGPHPAEVAVAARGVEE